MEIRKYQNKAQGEIRAEFVNILGKELEVKFSDYLEFYYVQWDKVSRG